MAWDFSTEPEFQAKLDWMREFLDNGQGRVVGNRVAYAVKIGKNGFLKAGVLGELV